MVITRYLADSIYAGDTRDVPASMLGGLLLTYGVTAPLAAVLYVARTQMLPRVPLPY